MKSKYGFIVVLSFLLSYQALAQMFTFNPSATIPDSILTGLTDTRTLTTSATGIQDLNIQLVLSGGSTAANGDFYATLTHGDGFAVLLNRVGRRAGEPNGYPENGLNIKLDDQAPNGDIHVYRFTLFGNNNTPVDITYQSPLSGIWAPDGREAPFSSVTDTTPRTQNPLAAFNGLDPNGSWTLFIADVSAGGVGILESWSLEVTPVPEPDEIGLVTACCLLGGAFFYRKRHQDRTTRR
jgi:hypothetical protein